MRQSNSRGRAHRLALGALIALPALAILAGEPAGASDDPKGYSFKYSNGLQFKRNDGMIKVKLGGRIQADFASISPDSSLEAAVPGNDGEGVEFRRARLFMSGDLYDRVVFKAQYDFADGPTKFKDVYLGLKNLGPVGTVRVGHMKEPFSLEELTSSKYITFMERALPSVFDSARNFGIAANNQHLDKRLTWGLGIFAPTDDSGDFFSSMSNLNITGRLTGLPLYQDKGRKLVHLGLSASHRVRDAFSSRFRQRPEAHLSQFRYLDTGTFLDDGSTLLAAEAAWVCGPFSLQGEYKHGWIGVQGMGTSSVGGAYVQASWFATGEHRPYKTKSATFARVSPKSPFNPGEGDWGAVELAARYSYLDVSDGAIDGGEEQNFTLGVNWYLFSNLRLMANYVYGDVKDTGGSSVIPNGSGSVNIFQTRAQIEF